LPLSAWASSICSPNRPSALLPLLGNRHGRFANAPLERTRSDRLHPLLKPRACRPRARHRAFAHCDLPPGGGLPMAENPIRRGSSLPRRRAHAIPRHAGVRKAANGAFRISRAAATRGTDVNGNPVTTVGQLITNWAPPSENNTAAYISSVTSQTGFSASHSLLSLVSSDASSTVSFLPTDTSSVDLGTGDSGDGTADTSWLWYAAAAIGALAVFRIV